MPWYVINKNNEVVVRCSYEPSSEDIASRDEIAVFSELYLDINKATYDGEEIKPQ